jgi:hypothetical protein
MASYVCPPRSLPGAPTSVPTMWRSAQRALADLAAKRVQKPVSLRRLARLAPDERPLVATCDSTDAAVVATNAAMHRLGPPEGSGDWSRWGWEQIARIEWDDPTAAMTLIGQAPLHLDPVVLSLPAPGPLVDAARERVAWTTQLATRVGPPSGGTVRVVARRHLTTDGLDWFVHPDTTVAGDGARGRAALGDAFAALRADTGL